MLFKPQALSESLKYAGGMLFKTNNDVFQEHVVFGKIK